MKINFKMNKKTLKNIGISILLIGLFMAGVGTTVAYNNFIDQVKGSGVAEFKINYCDKYVNKELTQSWLECDE